LLLLRVLRAILPITPRSPAVMACVTWNTPLWQPSATRLTTTGDRTRSDRLPPSPPVTPGSTDRRPFTPHSSRTPQASYAPCDCTPPHPARHPSTMEAPPGPPMLPDPQVPTHAVARSHISGNSQPRAAQTSDRASPAY